MCKRGDFFSLVLLCFSELIHFKIAQFTMFQNTTDHFRIEAGLIFQLAAITGKGKAECLRERPPIILHRCQNTWSDAKVIEIGTNTSII